MLATLALIERSQLNIGVRRHASKSRAMVLDVWTTASATLMGILSVRDAELVVLEHVRCALVRLHGRDRDGVVG